LVFFAGAQSRPKMLRFYLLVARLEAADWEPDFK